MPPRTLAIHAGWPKTATTTVQSALDHSRDQLRDLGFLYPRVGHENNINQCRAVRDLLRTTGSDLTVGAGRVSVAYWGVMRDAIRSFDGSAVISCERLIRGFRPSVVALGESFPDHELRVVVTTRRLSEWLPSYHQQLVKHGHQEDATDFLRGLLTGLLAGDPAFAWLDYEVVLDRWVGVIPVTAIHWVTVSSLPREDLVATVLSTLGLPAGGVTSPPELNLSLSAASVEGLRRFNLAHPELHRDDFFFVAERAMAAYPELVDKTAGGALRITPALSDAVDEAFPSEPSADAGHRVTGRARVEALLHEAAVVIDGRGPEYDRIADMTFEVATEIEARTRVRRRAFRALMSRRASAEGYFVVRRGMRRLGW